MIRPIAGALPDGIELMDSLVRIGEVAQVLPILMASSAVIPTTIEPKLIAFNSDEYSKDPKQVNNALEVPAADLETLAELNGETTVNLADVY